jgi:hypothetical protein
VRRAAAAAFLVLLLTSCEVRTDVTVHAGTDGAGSVAVSVTLDKEAAAQMTAQPRWSDLIRAGWRVHAAAHVRDSVVYRVEKPFRSPEEAGRVIAEVTGAAGPLRDVVLTHRRSLLRSRTRLTGTLDLTAGAASFGDPALTKLLGGKPIGVDGPKAAQVDQALRFQVTAALPGRTSTWTARSGQRVAIVAAAEGWNVDRIAFAAVAVLALAAFAVSVRRALRARRV